MVTCVHCRASIAPTSRFCPVCGRPQGSGDDTVAQIIPTRNVYALIAYYCGVFSIIPCFPIGFVGLGLGIKGLRHFHQFPEAHGRVHAWIGIVAGGLFGTLWLLATLAPFVAHALH